MQEERPRTRGVPMFIATLYRLASDPDYQDIVCFGPNDSGVCFMDKQQFVRNLLGVQFKAKKFTSLIRQLNNYEFRGATINRKKVFQHPAFIRDHPEELRRIRRRPIRQAAVAP